MHKEEISEIGNAGFVLTFNYTFGAGSQYLDCTYPKEWYDEYNNGNYALFDPTVVVNLAWPGTRRWSDFIVSYGDVRGIFKKAKKYSLNYGATICIRKSLGYSFLTIAKSDREVSDSELQFLEVKLENMLEIVSGKIELSDFEISIIKLLSSGLNQEAVCVELSIPKPTLKNKIQDLKKKLNAKNSTEIVAQALRRNII